MSTWLGKLVPWPQCLRVSFGGRRVLGGLGGEGVGIGQGCFGRLLNYQLVVDNLDLKKLSLPPHSVPDTDRPFEFCKRQSSVLCTRVVCSA